MQARLTPIKAGIVVADANSMTYGDVEISDGPTGAALGFHFGESTENIFAKSCNALAPKFVCLCGPVVD